MNVQSTNDAFIAIDVRGRIVGWNCHAVKMFGWSADEVMGLRLADIIIPVEYRDAHTKGLLRFDQAGESTVLDQRVDVLAQHRTGQCFPVEINIARVQLNGEPVFCGFVHAIGDVTTRKRMDFELQEKNRQLLKSERLAAIGEMVTGLAHECRNALQRCQASLDMLMHRVRDRPDETLLVQRIQESQDHLHSLYEQLRQYAAPVNLQVSRCRLDVIFDAAWKSLAPVRGQRAVTLEYRPNEVELKCEVDPLAMEQVFRNLLENSLAARGDPVKIHVQWAVGQANGKAAVVVHVQDNGPGFSAEFRDRIFQPFFTTKMRGTGLGLAIAKRLVEAHGGTISVDWNDSTGACLLLTIPRVAGVT